MSIYFKIIWFVFKLNKVVEKGFLNTGKMNPKSDIIMSKYKFNYLSVVPYPQGFNGRRPQWKTNLMNVNLNSLKLHFPSKHQWILTKFRTYAQRT
jgi:hypothetical protein